MKNKTVVLTIFHYHYLAATSIILAYSLYLGNLGVIRRRLHGGEGGDRPHGQIVGAMPSNFPLHEFCYVAIVHRLKVRSKITNVSL